MRLVLRTLVFVSLCLACLSSAPLPTHAEGISPAGADGDRPVKLWVHFTDHGEAGSSELRAMLNGAGIGSRARERRLRRTHRGDADIHDLPVNGPYVQALRTLGCDIRHESRYLNAVSAWVPPGTLDAIAGLPFVRRTEPVRMGMRPIPSNPVEGRLGEALLLEAGMDGGATDGVASGIDYGFTLSQNRMINTLPLHAAGYHGEGVRIAVLDTGFFRGHQALASLNVIAEWDFINDDPVTSDQLGGGSSDRWGQMSHGTLTLGALASNWPGRVMGTAWAAEYLLAKTERLFDEIQIEEDDYVAALEWADQLGADVVSSSLGYYFWYDYEDMDGKTAVSTMAVDIAASHGVLVVTAAGNEGGFPWPTLIAPADAAGAVTVGATDTLGVVTSFSSRGPTYDGRIKPDVVARGVLVVTLYWEDVSTAAAFNGTSASTPLVAGACALILQQNPDWSPTQVAEALRATASQADAPNNDYGWGVIDAAAASVHRQQITVALEVRAGSCESPFNPKGQGVLPTLLLGSEAVDVRDIDVSTLRLGGATAVHARIADLGEGSGDESCIPPSTPDGRDDLFLTFRTLDVAASISAAERGNAVALELTGALHDGTALKGVAWVRIIGNQGHAARAARVPPETIEGAHPNPFNPSTRISYRVPKATRVHLMVFDVSGRAVATLVDAHQPAGSYSVTWNATGKSSGVYFYRLAIDGIQERKRLVLIK